VQRAGRTPILPGLTAPPARAVSDASVTARNRFGVQKIDHITLNFLTLQPALMWMENVMGLEPYWTSRFTRRATRADTRQFSGSGLRSAVMWDPASGVKLANNEPAAPRFHASQIYIFCEDHHGAACSTWRWRFSDIVAAVRRMRQSGVEFMPSPGTYYDLPAPAPGRSRRHRIDEDLDALRTLGILVDGSALQSYLLQIFTREAAVLFDDSRAGPLFIELIQPQGDNGFGAGNFRALFESIERQQQIDSAGAAEADPEETRPAAAAAGR